MYKNSFNIFSRAFTEYIVQMYTLNILCKASEAKTNTEYRNCIVAPLLKPSVSFMQIKSGGHVNDANDLKTSQKNKCTWLRLLGDRLMMAYSIR